MMDETVPNASANTSGTAARRPRVTSTHTSSSRRPTSSPNHTSHARPRSTTSASPSTSPSPSTLPSTDPDDDRSRRRGGRFSNASLVFFSSPLFLLSRVILVLTVLLKILLFPVRKATNLLFPPGEFDNLLQPSVSQKAARAFAQSFTQDYLHPTQAARAAAASHHGGDDDDDDDDLASCPFVHAGYTSTVNDLARQGLDHHSSPNTTPAPPLLLIYVHSPLHGKVPAFLHNTLCHPRILSLLHEHRNRGTLMCWGGSIHTADGANAKETLQVTSFPFLSLVRIQPASSTSTSSSTSTTNAPVERKLEVLFRMEGPALQTIRPASLHTNLSNALVAYQTILTEQTTRRLARLEEIRLRQEQDREYRETLEEDRRRQTKKAEEARKKEEKARRIREEEERARRDEEDLLNQARDVLARNGEGEPPPPPSDASLSASASIRTARVRLMLPSGKRVERRFWANDTIDTIRAFLVLHFHEHGVEMKNFQLNRNYPKKALVDGEKTLESEGLCPQAVIMVQDLDA